MHLHTHGAPRSSPPIAPAVGQGGLESSSENPSPLLVSGFGSVMEKELDLQYSTNEYVKSLVLSAQDELGRILREQQTRLYTNITLLEHRHEMLPHPERFASLPSKITEMPEWENPPIASEHSAMLLDLSDQHRQIQTDIESLISQGHDGQRGELMLLQVARSHEEMAWVLRSLLKEDVTERNEAVQPIDVIPTVGTTEAGWENEGGPPKGAVSPPNAASVPDRHVM